MPEEMRVDPERAKQLLQNFKHVTARVQAANKSQRQIRLIAVSKLHPASNILALHQHSAISSSSLPSSAPAEHLHFGENYVQELQQKAEILPRSIRWHFIGGLQSNKCRPLAESVENLWCVSSVDSAKKADQLDKGRANLIERRTTDGATDELEKLRVQVQVNTSGEADKSGVQPEDAAALCSHIREKCTNLQLSGLMTIGAIARSKATAETENEDFDCLKQTRDRVVQELGLAEGDLGLSMGMSADFEGAIAQGSDEVRVGSDIFGERPPKGEARVLEDVEKGKS